MSKTLRDLGPGDEVAIMERSYRCETKLIVPIVRVTKTQIVTGTSSRWRRDGGREIPERRYGLRQYITPATDEHRHGEERERLRAVIRRGLGSAYQYMPDLRTDTLRTIADALRGDPATEGM